MLHGEVIRKADAQAVVEEAAARFLDAARRAIAQHGKFHVALSGGSTPKALYEWLASHGRAAASDPASPAHLDWTRVVAFFGDERWVPKDHPDSNFAMVKRSGFADLRGITVERVLTEEVPGEAARLYEEKVISHFHPRGGRTDELLPPRLDLVLLGLGPDGHTASLFPNGHAIKERHRWVTDTPPEGNPLHSRITMTLPLLCAAKETLILVAGAEKSAVLRAVRDAPADPGPLGDEHPVLLVRPVDGTLTWLVDHAAAAALI